MTRRRTDRAVSQLRDIASVRVRSSEADGVDPLTWDRLTPAERVVVRVFAEALREIWGFEEDLLRLGEEHIRGLTAELSRQHAEAVTDRQARAT